MAKLTDYNDEHLRKNLEKLKQQDEQIQRGKQVRELKQMYDNNLISAEDLLQPKTISNIPELTDEQKMQKLMEPGAIAKLMQQHKQKMDDVWSVFLDHPVYVRIRQQIDKGLNKYNTPVQPDHYSIFGWFEHLQQESTDKIVYNEIMLMKLQETIKYMKLALKAGTLEENNHYLELALEILESGKN